MKKLSILFLSIIATTFSIISCSDMDDVKAIPIEGKWELSQKGIIVNGKEILEPTLEDCSQETYEYLEDGTFVNNYFEDYNSECNPSSKTGTWNKNKNILTTKYDDESTEEEAEILELTDNTLKLKYVGGNEYVKIFVRK